MMDLLRFGILDKQANQFSQEAIIRIGKWG